MTFRKLLRDPLVHFLGLGLALFLLYAVIAPVDRGGETIVVSKQDVAGLSDQFQKLWGRPPNAQELTDLVENRVRDEILYREGVAMGLDKDDAVIKRRVRQKYDLISEEEDAGAAPTDAELAAYLKANPDRFRAPAILSFRQLLINQAATPADIAALKARLASGTQPQLLGAPSLLPAQVTDMPLDLVAREFGSDFAGALGTLPVGEWSGPVASPFGAHFVRIDARTPAELPALADVRPQVAREWENERREKARETRLVALRKQYDVTVEGLPTTTAK